VSPRVPSQFAWYGELGYIEGPNMAIAIQPIPNKTEKECDMKNHEVLWVFLLTVISTLVLSLPARAAQDQPLEISDITYKSEDGTGPANFTS
jgi:hypothetical protein